MNFKKTFIAFILVSFIISFLPSGQALPPGCPHLSSPVPANGAEDVVITAKGVQTCINVSVPQGCTVNVTLQWFNYSDYIWDWIWCIFLGVGCPVLRTEDQYWTNYTTEMINQDTTVCGWNSNVSCSIYGYEYSYDWRVVADFDCGQSSYQEICYYDYSTEECDLFYIYPNMSQTNVCPCCDKMCIGIDNEFGNTMNISFYRNDSQFEDFYLVNKLTYVNNGTYCFCIDGHINDSLYYPTRYNETYYWYVNVTDTVTGLYNVSDTFIFKTAENTSDCPCGFDALNETFTTELEDNIRSDAWIVGVAIVFSMIPLGIIVRRRRK